MSSPAKCQQCGAQLPVSRVDDQGIVRCEYCGAESRVTVPRVPAPAPAPAPRSQRARPSAKKSESLRFWLAAIALVIGGAVVFFLVYSVDQRTKGTRHQYGVRNMPQDRGGWFELDLEGIDVTPSRQDAIANLAWVKRFAHAWSQDAVLTWMQTTVRADGFALDAPLIEYKFISPAKARAQRELGAVGGQGAPLAGLTVNVVGDTARAFLAANAQGKPDTPAVELACSFEDLMASAVKIGGKAIADQPVHQLRLEYQVGEWAWNVGRSRIYLDPASCAEAESPYTRAMRQRR